MAIAKPKAPPRRTRRQDAGQPPPPPGMDLESRLAFEESQRRAREGPARRPKPRPRKPPDKPVTGARMVWRVLTPWVEESGDTFVDYMKGWPKRVRDSYVQEIRDIRKPGIPDQNLMKATFDAERNAPLWAKLLGGGGTVAKVKTRDGQVLYVPVSAGVVPLVGPAKALKVVSAPARALRQLKTLGPEDVGLPRGSFNQFVRQRALDPRLTVDQFKANEITRSVRQRGIQVDWQKLANEIAKGNVKNADDAVKFAARTRAPVPPTGARGPIPGQRILTGKEELADVRRAIAAFNKSVKARTPAPGRPGIVAFTVPDSKRPSSEWRPFNPGELDREQMQAIIKRWESQTPSKATAEMNASNLTAVAIATDPNAAIRIITKLTPADQKKLLPDISKDLRRAIEQKNAKKAQQAAAADVQTQGAVQAAAKAATDAGTKAQAQGKTDTQIRQAVETAIQTATKTITDPAVKTKTQTQLKTTVKQLMKTKVQPKAELAAPPKAPAPKKTGAPTVPGVPTTPAPTRPAEPTIPSARLPRLPGAPPRKDRPLTKKEREGAVAWRQGIVFVVVVPPFATRADIRFFRKLPAGVKLARDARTAAQTIQTITGKPPSKDIKVRLGFATATIRQPTREPGKAGAITFTAERRRAFAEPAAPRSNLVSRRRGRIFVTPTPRGGKMLSRRPIPGARVTRR